MSDVVTPRRNLGTSDQKNIVMMDTEDVIKTNTIKIFDDIFTYKVEHNMSILYHENTHYFNVTKLFNAKHRIFRQYRTQKHFQDQLASFRTLHPGVEPTYHLHGGYPAVLQGTYIHPDFLGYIENALKRPTELITKIKVAQKQDHFILHQDTRSLIRAIFSNPLNEEDQEKE